VTQAKNIAAVKDESYGIFIANSTWNFVKIGTLDCYQTASSYEWEEEQRSECRCWFGVDGGYAGQQVGHEERDHGVDHDVDLG